MTLPASRRIALTGAALLAFACAPFDDLAEDAPPPRPAPTEAATSPEPQPAPSLAHETAIVLWAIDGDTFDARLADGRTERVRPPQFDAPERGECWHDEATALLEQLIGGRNVQLVPLSDGPERDRHGRLLRAVEVDGQDVGALMLEAGAARWLDRYAHEDARLARMYEAAGDQARKEGTGAWSACPNWK